MEDGKKSLLECKAFLNSSSDAVVCSMLKLQAYGPVRHSWESTVKIQQEKQ